MLISLSDRWSVRKTRIRPLAGSKPGLDLKILAVSGSVEDLDFDLALLRQKKIWKGSDSLNYKTKPNFILL